MKRVEERLVLKKTVKKVINQIAFSIIMVLIGMILIKKDSEWKNKIEENVYEKSLHFTKTQEIYQKYFGDILEKRNKKETKQVSKEAIIYDNLETYKNGIKLQVEKNSTIQALESGVIIYLGEKEDYGNTIVIEQVDGVDTWYGNIENTNYKLYDYIEQGEILGSTITGYYYLAFQKKGEFLDYKEYI